MHRIWIMYNLILLTSFVFFQNIFQHRPQINFQHLHSTFAFNNNIFIFNIIDDLFHKIAIYN